jgi:aminoglycoside phosphotransferase (APT) family kinase protein
MRWVPSTVGLGDLGRPDGYVDRQLRRWFAQFVKSTTRELPLVEEIHDFLATRIPQQTGTQIVHGDYRLGNCLCATDGTIVAVLDWEICTLGDPLADLGYVLSGWAEQGERGADAISPSAVSGFPTRAELVEAYADMSGRDVSLVDFYLCFSHWKAACIVEGVYARHLAGALDGNSLNLESCKRRVDREIRLASEAASRLG